jgi:hypothetical protein
MSVMNMIPPGSGWELYPANAIKGNGQIAGDGFYNGQIDALLLTPTGELPRL